MPRKHLSAPTEVELEILNVLWDHGPRTVRQVHNTLAPEKGTGYSTTLKMMQVMHEKGLVQRDESVRPQLYRPTESQAKTQMKMLDRLVHGAFGGAMSKLLVHALSSKRVSQEELKEIKQIIRQREKDES